jgi:hypothetical protein
MLHVTARRLKGTARFCRWSSRRADERARRRGRDDVSMWVGVMDWMLADDEPPKPTAGSLLRSVGVRVRGAVTAAYSDIPDGVAEVPDADSSGQDRDVYAVTGIASNPKDVSTNTKRWGRGVRSGAEFVLLFGADQFQVQFDGRASEVPPESRVTVTGGLELVGEYEWDAFELRDTRADWLVTKVVALPDGDIAVNLARASS